MNEDDRTELERLIAAARPVGPSEELDARVRKALLGGPRPQPKRRERRPDRRLSLAVAASVLVAAGIGFVCGRLTADNGESEVGPNVSLQVIEPSDATQPGKSHSATQSSVAAQSIVIPLPEERLAGLFVQSRSREGLLGAGPVTVEVSSVR